MTLIEAAELLGTFDAPLREYATDKLHKQGVRRVKASPSCHAVPYSVNAGQASHTPYTHSYTWSHSNQEALSYQGSGQVMTSLIVALAICACTR